VPVAAHAHGTPAVEQAVAIGVDGVEHCRCVTTAASGRSATSLWRPSRAARSRCAPSIGVDSRLMKEPPPASKAMIDRRV
jgi:imidazolonepropionase-like amidohydrolase